LEKFHGTAGFAARKRLLLLLVTKVKRKKSRGSRDFLYVGIFRKDKGEASLAHNIPKQIKRLDFHSAQIYFDQLHFRYRAIGMF